MVQKKSSTTKKEKTDNSGSMAIVALILNILVLPGLGTIIGGKTDEGIWQMILVVGSLIVGTLLTVTIIGAIIGLPLMFLGPLAGWIWGLISGVQLVKETQ